MSFDTPKLPEVSQAPLPPPVFGEVGSVKRKKGAEPAPTFLGTGSIPNVTQLGSKTLLGQ